MRVEEILDNLIVELKRGTQVLAVLSQLHSKQYGYSLLQCLEEKGTKIEAGTLYPLLRRLETQGIVTSNWDTSEARPRKFYELSLSGHRTLALLKIEWKRMCDDMNKLLEEKV